MKNFADWHRVEFKVDDDDDNPYGPIPGFVDAVLDAIGPGVIAGSHNRLRALGCVLLGGVALFAEDRVLKVSKRDLRRFAVGALGRAARLPGDDVQSLITFCTYAVDLPQRKTEQELATLVKKYPDLEDDIRRDADIVASFLDDPQSHDAVWEKSFAVGRAEFEDWWDNPDLFSSKRIIKAVQSAPADPE